MAELERINLVIPPPGGVTYPMEGVGDEMPASPGTAGWQQTQRTTIETTVEVPKDLAQPTEVKSVSLKPEICRLDREEGQLGVFGLLDLVLQCQTGEKPQETGQLLAAGEVAQKVLASRGKTKECWDDFFMELLDDDKLIESVMESSDCAYELKECMPFYLNISDQDLMDGQLIRLCPQVEECKCQIVEPAGIKVKVILAVEAAGVEEGAAEEQEQVKDITKMKLMEDELAWPTQEKPRRMSPADEILEQLPDLVEEELELEPELVDELLDEDIPEGPVEEAWQLKPMKYKEVAAPMEQGPVAEPVQTKPMIKYQTQTKPMAQEHVPQVEPVAGGMNRWRQRRVAQKVAMEEAAPEMVQPVQEPAQQVQKPYRRPSQVGIKPETQRKPSMTIKF